MKRRTWIPAALSAILVAGLLALPTALAAPGGGRILVTVASLDWKALGSDAILSNGLDVSLLTVATDDTTAIAGAAPDLPTAFNGRRLRLVEVQFCYDATATGVSMTSFVMRVQDDTTGANSGNPVAGVGDTTARTDETCRIYPVDWVLEPGNMAAAGIQVHFDTAGAYFEIGRLTFVLEPTNDPI